ncbi:(deoxy)nucleoside triphosphate pyrophosphohydrolase [Actinomadura madurae]|uniref:(deoxy)nucleoside triphosphate pyrophosphohydrolase n=2 Tax=Actinomadura madurae TaxID=1993 RepID=UPI0020260C00|nr:(deoxy)nucleoside triphosphate pyrophosphohydrolase [Actinomadura madurae]MCP9966985.1 (deoxy)nucleoside triphosphate pyrophosphohydrolase [Actinomadura madurae]MCP9979453.1 (deoxy)nucleoside triphosphate pyrophosphohydrolase [Actinomadura madurae]MCQ0009015.1 (deoxy)nucleoside triphosphate pyrophosphohydrolase [Actinomadura madurae]MCQ0015664.1 (deoxy)nucleoside triphosphate pyrophosphohydrolase [Actinomadura madurae]URN01598.1 (deoxy)nucleoside triphosphate pyrophosphohydrolase [Actinomad
MDLVVVGAAIISDGRLLSAQRSEPPHMAGGWELPGGKVDPGESDEDALVRECHEELAVKVSLGRRIGGDWRLSDRSVLRVWTARITEGEPRPLEHLALRWLTPPELYDVPWLPGDRPVIEALAAQGLTP